MQSSSLDQTLKEKFNLHSFRSGQKEIISSLIQGKDLLAVLPTGGGKSLCYQFPAVYFDKLVIVVSPLIALMRDQVKSLSQMQIRAGAIYSGQEEDEKRQVFAEIQKGGAFVLYLSPERVQKQGFQNWIQNRAIALFAIDEAHCVSQWGHDFREEYSLLNLLKKLRPDVPTLALTASATPTVLHDIAKQLELKNPLKKVYGFYRSNLYFQVEICDNEDMKNKFLIQALQQTPEGRVIIYCGTRKKTEELCDFLSEKFQAVGYYHAGLSSEKRSFVQEQYQNSKLRILVATNAFGMGIDQPDVRLVVHYQMPATIDSLYQEMGRAGRDGLESTCLLLYAAKDKGLQSFFIQSSEADEEIKSARWRNLDTLINYCESSECRQAEILTYYQDAQRIKQCGHCDNCLPDSSRKIMPPAKLEILKSSGGSKKKSKNSKDSLLTPAQEPLFQALKVWRKNKATELDVPAFIIFSDRTLRELAIQHPGDFNELRNIHGIGPEKLERFGADVMLLLSDFHP